MMELLVLKERLRSFYGKFGNYIIIALKFILVLLGVILINGMTGGRGRYNGTLIAVILGGLCCPLPTGAIIFVNAMYLLYQVYQVSLEVALVMMLLMFLMSILAFGIKPGYGILLILTPIAFMLKIPYIIPMAMGLLGSFSAILPISYGVIIYYMLEYLSNNSATLSGGAAAFDLQRVTQFIDYMIGNRSMQMMIVTFAVTLIVVYVIRRMTVDHAWSIATGVGAVLQISFLLVGDFVFDISISIAGLLLGMFFAILIAFLLEFVFFAVDYTRTEYTQFEDDEYVYYVKAVPKIAVTEPQVKIQKFNTRQIKNVEGREKDR